MKKIKEKVLSYKYFTWLQFVSNWLMQGIFHADKTEKRYKILFTVVLWAVVFAILYYSFNVVLIKSFIYGFIIAHTMNWVVNNNLFVLMVKNEQA